MEGGLTKKIMSHPGRCHQASKSRFY